MTDEVNKEVSKESISAETAKMSDKDIKWRERYKNTVADLENVKISAEKEREALNASLKNLSSEQEKIRARLVDAKVEAAAVAAGITDADLVQLIVKDSIDKIKIAEDGTIVGVAEAVQEFKARKPHFFGTEKKVASSTNAKVPEKEVVTKVHAKDLTDSDFELKMRQLKSGQRL